MVGWRNRIRIMVAGTLNRFSRLARSGYSGAGSSSASSHAAALGRELISFEFVKGEGIEIGALHMPLPVSSAAKVKYVDRMSAADLRKQYPELDGFDLVPTDIIDDGERLRKFKDVSQDFVIANHFIEHCEDPIGTLKNLLRVIRPGGVLYLAIPDKRYTFDIERQITPLDHLLRDHAEGPAWSKRQHVEDWARHVNKMPTEEEVHKQTEHILNTNYSVHYHVWTQAELFELLVALKRQFNCGFDVEAFLKHKHEMIFILRKDS